MYVYKLTQYNPEYVWDGEEETIYEIARISNGNISEIAIENAKELRKVC